MIHNDRQQNTLPHHPRQLWLLCENCSMNNGYLVSWCSNTERPIGNNVTGTFMDVTASRCDRRLPVRECNFLHGFYFEVTSLRSIHQDSCNFKCDALTSGTTWLECNFFDYFVAEVLKNTLNVPAIEDGASTICDLSLNVPSSLSWVCHNLFHSVFSCEFSIVYFCWYAL